MSKLLLIDCYSLLFRAFFSSPPFSTSAGEPTGALYGFARMVTALLDEHNPDYVAVAIDAPGGTFRHEADETYKANRNDTPDDLKIQQKLVREMLDGLGIPRYEHAGFEADDIIGTLAKKGESQGQKVIVVTGDGDMLQLVDENITVMLTKRGVSDLDIYDPAAVVKRYEFEAARVPDFKGLKGDASDNIPGVPGIGDKTATTLLTKYGSLDGIYQNLDDVAPARIQKLLREHQEQAFHSRTMATIITDLPVEKAPEEFRYEPNDPEKRRIAGETARRFEFRSLAKRYETPAQIAKAEPEPMKEYRAELTVGKTVEEVENWLTGELTSVAWIEDQLWLGRDGQALLFDGEIGAMKIWLENADAPKIAHDVKSLERALQPHQIHLRGAVADTLLMSYLVEPTRQNHPIDLIAEKYANLQLPAAPAPLKKSAPKNLGLFDDDNAEISAEEQQRLDEERSHVAAQVAVFASSRTAFARAIEGNRRRNFVRRNGIAARRFAGANGMRGNAHRAAAVARTGRQTRKRRRAFAKLYLGNRRRRVQYRLAQAVAGRFVRQNEFGERAQKQVGRLLDRRSHARTFGRRTSNRARGFGVSRHHQTQVHLRGRAAKIDDR